MFQNLPDFMSRSLQTLLACCLPGCFRLCPDRFGEHRWRKRGIFSLYPFHKDIFMLLFFGMLFLSSKERVELGEFQGPGRVGQGWRPPTAQTPGVSPLRASRVCRSSQGLQRDSLCPQVPLPICAWGGADDRRKGFWSSWSLGRRGRRTYSLS